MWKLGDQARLRRLWRRYRRESRRPLVGYLFLLPLAAIYELGVALVGDAQSAGAELLVPQSVREVLAWFGLIGGWLPTSMVLVGLLIWYRWRRDGWHVRLGALPTMAVEGLLLAVPLLVVALLFQPSADVTHTTLAGRFVRAVGAGLYEELLFRWLLVGVAVGLLVARWKIPLLSARTVMIGFSAVVFSLSHLQPLGAESFTWPAFVFRLVAGVYLAILFVSRGIGVCTGCHVLYNLMFVLSRG